MQLKNLTNKAIMTLLVALLTSVISYSGSALASPVGHSDAAWTVAESIDIHSQTEHCQQQDKTCNDEHNHCHCSTGCAYGISADKQFRSGEDMTNSTAITAPLPGTPPALERPPRPPSETTA